VKPLARIGSVLVLLVALAWVPGARAQATAPSSQAPIILVRSVRVLPDRRGPAIEIISTAPITPILKRLDSPSRLVVDLPNAKLTSGRKRIDFRNEQINGVRVDQYQDKPPVARVVVDLAKPVDYTWDAAGNRLMVRLQAASAEAARSTAPSVAGFTSGIQAAVPSGSGSSGALMVAGNRIAAGSAISAGSDTAILHLPRGGEVRVCPGTTVSVTPSQSSHDNLMLGMSTGALETHYRLEASADSIVTPDFRIMLAGPGEFDYAVSVDRRGNTCVRALPGNTASVIVSELMGSGTYQVTPAERIVFLSGHLRSVDTNIPTDCGCPEPTTPVLRTEAPSGPEIPDARAASTLKLAQAGEKPASSDSALAASNASPSSAMPGHSNLAAALPASHSSDVQVQIDAPFVFRAPHSPGPAPVREATALPLVISCMPGPLPPMIALPPPPPPAETVAQTEHRGFFRKLGGFFAGIFR